MFLEDDNLEEILPKTPQGRADVRNFIEERDLKFRKVQYSELEDVVSKLTSLEARVAALEPMKKSQSSKWMKINRFIIDTGSEIKELNDRVYRIFSRIGNIEKTRAGRPLPSRRTMSTAQSTSHSLTPTNAVLHPAQHCTLCEPSSCDCHD